MELERCQHKGKPAYRWGPEGTPYTYTVGDPKSRTSAKNRALKQGRDIKAVQKKRKRK